MYDMMILNEDGSKPETLKRTEVSQADLLLVTTDDESVNLAVTRHAKKEFGIPRIVAIANNPKNKARLAEADADPIKYCFKHDWHKGRRRKCPRSRIDFLTGVRSLTN